MRTLKYTEYEIETETDQEQREARRYHPAAVVIWRGARHTIGAGTADSVYLFEEDGALIILSRNRGLGYAGLQVFRDGIEASESFVDTEELGDYLLGLTPIYAAKRMTDWCDL